MGSFIWYKKCHKCGGNLFVEKDGLDIFLTCLQCSAQTRMARVHTRYNPKRQKRSIIAVQLEMELKTDGKLAKVA